MSLRFWWRTLLTPAMPSGWPRESSPHFIQPFLLDGLEVFKSTSIGIALTSLIGLPRRSFRMLISRCIVRKIKAKLAVSSLTAQCTSKS